MTGRPKRDSAIDERILHLADQGWSRQDIANDIGHKTVTTVGQVIRQRERDEIEARNAKIIGLVNQGHSNRTAAERLGITKNTVAGVMYRHGHLLSKEGKSGREERNPSKRTLKDQGTSGLIPPEKTCQWPLWGNEDYRDPKFGKFCGNKCKRGKSYCPMHHRIAVKGTVKVEDLR